MSRKAKGHVTLVIEAAQSGRFALRAALGDLEEAIASPGPGREAEWSRRVAAEIERVQAAWEEHRQDVEANGGLLEEVIERAPRLSRMVDALRKEHNSFRGVLAGCSALVNVVAGQADRLLEAREAALNLLGQAARHRQLVADLVYEAFHRDIGGHA